MGCRVVPFLLVTLFVLFCMLETTSARTYSTHEEYYQVDVPYSESSCRNYPCRYRCWWHRYRYWYHSWDWDWDWSWGWGCGYRFYCNYCNTVRSTRKETRKRCQPYWTGPSCNIPLCTQTCSNGKVCVPGNKCECLTAGGSECAAVGCTTPVLSCYPGTCVGSSTCDCPPQFNGTNCQTILQTPDISECSVKLFSGTPEVEVASANCAVEGHDPETTWVNKATFSRIEASWEAKDLYPYEPVLPTSTSHIDDVKFGVTDAKATVTINSASRSSPIDKDITPVCKVETSPPASYVDCKRRSILWTEFGLTTLPVNSTLEVTIAARLGGFKKLRSTKTNEAITGLQFSKRKVLFKVDAKAPFHCRQSDKKCEDPAIYVLSDAVQNPIVEFEFSNWYDGESGIQRYDFAIYEMLKSSGLPYLVRSLKAIHSDSVTGNKIQFTFPSPGVYSLELTVYDHAKNPSKARKIMLYDNKNQLTKSTEPLRVEQASKETEYKWITKPLRSDANGRSRLTLSWAGRYSNMKHINDGWLSRVAPWNDLDGIDDNLVNGGNRTIHAIQNSNGTVGYRMAFVVDNQGGFDMSSNNFEDGNNLTSSEELPQSTWVTLGSEVTTKDLMMPSLTSNDTVGIWMEAYDAVGYSIKEHILVRLDSSDPQFDSNQPAILRQNFPDAYQSSIEIKVKDLESGIREVRYYIYDASLRRNVTHGKAEVRKRKRSVARRRRSTLAVCKVGIDNTCYCITGGECFENVIQVTIDHCEIDKFYSDERIMEFHYVVTNQAGSSVVPNEHLIMKFEAGKPNCRPVAIFTAGTILAIAIGLLVLCALVVLVIFMILRWKQDKHPIPDKVRSFATSVRQKVTNTEKVLDSDGRVIFRSKTRHGRMAEDDDDIYVDGRDPGGWRVNPDQLELAETLADGKFAIVKKAYLSKGGERKVVAAKYLPTGASESDKTLFKAKLAFHGNRVPPHDNIVKLVGVYDEGPVMLLEFCEMTLKEWLSKVSKVDTDALETMLNFTTHIANGMDHLHSKSIVHRRLAIRNVLLKKDGINGLVAKLIGFGTFNDAGSGEEAAETSVAVPLKWLAPESLESVGKGKAIYTQKSDVWSYGVTIWEIYSLGATPYSGKKSAEVEALLKTGYRMPRPNECPPELFDTVVTPCWNAAPKKRPDFKTICKQIRSFRSGGDTQEGYYAVDPKSKSYDNPKERTADYISRKKAPGNDYHIQEELYDDTRK